jgi:3-deoxy-D-manno-octulosonic-acid transferase
MVLANARLSERSARRGRKLAALLHPAGRSLAMALAQTPEDAARLLASGVPSAPVCGNLKYDITPNPAQLAQGRRWREALARPVLLFANTRDGEEAPLLALWRTLRMQRAAQAPAPMPLLMLVPRHPQRFDAVGALVQDAGLSLARRSQWQGEAPAAAHTTDVWLGDSLGELPLYYAAADVALLGGSFQPLGGHNLIEAAASACPIVLGPSTFNFAEAAELALAAGAAWRATGLEDALHQALAVLADEPRRHQAAEAATRFSSAHRGAAQRMAQAVLALGA